MASDQDPPRPWWKLALGVACLVLAVAAFFGLDALEPEGTTSRANGAVAGALVAAGLVLLGLHRRGGSGGAR